MDLSAVTRELELMLKDPQMREMWKEWGEHLQRDQCRLKRGADQTFTRCFLAANAPRQCIESVMKTPCENDHQEHLVTMLKCVMSNGLDTSSGEQDIVNELVVRFCALSKYCDRMRREGSFEWSNPPLKRRFWEDPEGEEAELKAAFVSCHADPALTGSHRTPSSPAAQATPRSEPGEAVEAAAPQFVDGRNSFRDDIILAVSRALAALASTPADCQTLVSPLIEPLSTPRKGTASAASSDAGSHCSLARVPIPLTPALEDPFPLSGRATLPGHLQWTSYYCTRTADIHHTANRHVTSIKRQKFREQEMRRDIGREQLHLHAIESLLEKRQLRAKEEVLSQKTLREEISVKHAQHQKLLETRIEEQEERTKLLKLEQRILRARLDKVSREIDTTTVNTKQLKLQRRDLEGPPKELSEIDKRIDFALKVLNRLDKDKRSATASVKYVKTLGTTAAECTSRHLRQQEEELAAVVKEAGESTFGALQRIDAVVSELVAGRCLIETCSDRDCATPVRNALSRCLLEVHHNSLGHVSDGEVLVDGFGALHDGWIDECQPSAEERNEVRQLLNKCEKLICELSEKTEIKDQGIRSMVETMASFAREQSPFSEEKKPPKSVKAKSGMPQKVKKAKKEEGGSITMSSIPSFARLSSSVVGDEIPPSPVTPSSLPSEVHDFMATLRSAFSTEEIAMGSRCNSCVVSSAMTS